MPTQAPTTSLCRYTDTEIFYRDRNLVDDLLSGQADFVSVMMSHILGREVTPAQQRVMHAILIVMMEHGLTPSAIATRSIYMSAPENLQGAVAAGLLAVGSQFVGTIENNARLLAELVDLDTEAQAARAAEIVREHRTRKAHLPGFGHHLHRPDDPRALKLIEIGKAESASTRYIDALLALSAAVDAEFGRHITINATGATAALLGDMDIPVELMRGFAVISRAAGLVAHIAEEQQKPSGRFIWETVDKAMPFGD
ncbi:citryl-CoA lyase [Sagittula sp. P11]|uniref:citryl-CoA lyase n=1 Tax=unclassified Sagittula TaxID=2624628 RepID=UPI000C2CF6F0|nr:citryl-CoA lyase [Sagittula sp. P11]AUC54368.1 citryl-CoA lyase [Sagittula sp. P11]